MARKKTIDTTALTNYRNSTATESEAPKSNIHPNSLKNLHPRSKGKTEKKYMQLDIIEFEDYLNRMSKYKSMTRTKYIQELIRQDFQQHEDEYNLLKNLPEFDKK